MENKNSREELKELSPFLSKMKKKEDGFSTPENYFNYLENSIMEQVSLEPNPLGVSSREEKNKPWFSWFSAKTVASFASVLLLIGAGLFLINQKTEPTTNVNTFAELTEEEILNYLSDNIDDLDVYSIGELTEENTGSDFDMLDLDEKDMEYILEEYDGGDLEDLL